MAKNIIFDTDLGGDCDDVVALDLLLSAHKAGECRLLGVSSSLPCASAPGCIYEILRQHGCAEIPVAHMTPTANKQPEAYATPVVKKFGSAETPTYENTPEAVSLLRSLLAKHTHVTLVATGPLTNLGALLASGADEFSPLNGTELVKAAADEVVFMGCNFWHENGRNPDPGYVEEDGTLKPVCEWNIFCDIPAARLVADSCPVPLVCSPFELGYNVFSGGEMCRRGKGEVPDSFSLLTHGAGEAGQHSWDPATALYAVYGARPWFYKTVKGRIILDEAGIAHFDSQHGGEQIILQNAGSAAELAEAIDGCIRRLF